MAFERLNAPENITQFLFNFIHTKLKSKNKNGRWKNTTKRKKQIIGNKFNQMKNALWSKQAQNGQFQVKFYRFQIDARWTIDTVSVIEDHEKIRRKTNQTNWRRTRWRLSSFLTSFWVKFQDFRTAKNMVRWIKLFWLFYILILIILKRWTTRKYWNVRKQQFCQLRKLFFTTYFCKRTKFQSDEA